MRRVAIVLFGVAAVLLIAVVALVAGSGGSHPQRPVAVIGARTSDDSRVLDLTLGSCPARVFGQLDDRTAVVKVSITTSSPDEHRACTQPMSMVLRAPLGDRTVVDLGTGRPVTVQKVTASELQQPLTHRVIRPLRR